MHKDLSARKFFRNTKKEEFESTKGQIKPEADWRAVDSPKKRTNEFGFFALSSGNT